MPRRSREAQLGLFGEPSQERVGSVAPAPVSGEEARLADALLGGVHLGTSSWTFPGWSGLVYDKPTTQAALARYGLRAYGAHPLFRSVGLDRTFYNPMSEGEMRRLADQVPEGFRFLVKAHQAVTRPEAGGQGAGPVGEGPNPLFLDVSYTVERVVAPAVWGLGGKCGPILFQFSPMDLTARGLVGSPDRFLDRLEAFLSRLPKGPLYAVEIRNRELLTPEYAAVLADTGVAHGYNAHPLMPSPEMQDRVVPLGDQPALVARWMLHPSQSYLGARARYEPFDRLVDEDEGVRVALARMVRRAVGLGREAWVIANNKAEGSAPLTIRRLAGAIVGRT